MEGRRDRRRRELRGRIIGAAMRLFLERGFDRVRVAEIAAEADVAEKTVFNHFPTKGDLVSSTGDELMAELITTVRERPDGESVVEAVRRFRTRPPEPGRPDGPTAEFFALIHGSPALQAHHRVAFARWETELAEELARSGEPGGGVPSFVVAAALMAVLRAPFELGPDDGHRGALAALDLLDDGLRDYGRKPG